jgi:pimeloyl-ACP methyl ester carboxylesterase
MPILGIPNAPPMRYDDIGTGIPLLLVHGFPLDHGMWRPQVETLRDECRCIVPDLHGLGTSPLAEDPATMEGFALALKTLLDKLAIDQAVVCGFSMGGYIALAFQELYPERVRGLILCSTRSLADDGHAKLARATTAENALVRGMAEMAPKMAADLLSKPTRKDRPELVAEVEEIIARQSPAGVAAASQGMALRPDRSAQLKRIDVPVLILAGDADTLIASAQSEAMAAQVGDARLVVFPGGGHLVNMEQPTAFNAELVRFLARLD